LHICNIICQGKSAIIEEYLVYLTKRGYQAEIAVPVDMFPWTEYVETIIMMTNCDQKGK